MAGEINTFKTSFTKDLARPSRFDVLFAGNSSLSFRCENAELPSRTFATAEQKIGANPTEKFPYHSNYNDVTLTFIVSDNMAEKIYFDRWMNDINPTSTFNFKYKKPDQYGSGYVQDISIRQYNVKNEESYSIRLIEAYPISVNQLDLDWSADGHHKLSVVFAYSYWQPIKYGAFPVDYGAFPINLTDSITQKPLPVIQEISNYAPFIKDIAKGI